MIKNMSYIATRLDWLHRHVALTCGLKGVKHEVANTLGLAI